MYVRKDKKTWETHSVVEVQSLAKRHERTVTTATFKQESKREENYKN